MLFFRYLLTLFSSRLAAMNMEAGSVVAGNRSYFLTGCGLQLNLALVQYGLDFLREKGKALLMFTCL